MPFDAATGAVEQNFSFLQTNHGSIDLTWYNLYQSAANPIVPIDKELGMGCNWSASQFAEVIVDEENETVAVVFAPGRAGCGGNGPGGGGPGGGGPD